MPSSEDAIDIVDLASQWRRHLHQNPELQFDVFNTASFVADKLREFGFDEVITEVGKTGVVGVIRGLKGDGKTVGLRADMDALPLVEKSGQPWTSTKPGRMHACGHDGHTSMLLGAAKHLASNRDFRGSVALIFQPAEEGGGGGREMLRDGLMERFGICEVYGMHNIPGLPIGQFAIRSGPVMAASDEFKITITGAGGHAAEPHKAVDPIIAGAQIVNSLQSIVSRGVNPVDTVVVSVTEFHGGDCDNLIPEEATLVGTVRSFLPATRDFAERRLREIIAGVSAAFNTTCEIRYDRSCPAVFNHSRETKMAIRAAQKTAGIDAVDDRATPMMLSEDFAVMLEARPGAFIFIGNGDSSPLHSPKYDFNDNALSHGINYWINLVAEVQS